MAIYHYSEAVISRGKAQSACAASAYVSKTTLKEDSTQQLKTHDYSRQSAEVVASELTKPAEMPADWDAEKLWNNVENAEKLQNAQLAKRVNIALPAEFNHEQMIKLAREWASRRAAEGRACQWAIHDKDGTNPHVDALMTIRPYGKNGWGVKSREIYIVDKNGKKIHNPKSKNGKHKYKTQKVQFDGGKDGLVNRRIEWEGLCNDALRLAGLAKTVSADSLKDQRLLHKSYAESARQCGDFKSVAWNEKKAKQLDREPTVHVGCKQKWKAMEENEAIKNYNFRKKYLDKKIRKMIKKKNRMSEFSKAERCENYLAKNFTNYIDDVNKICVSLYLKNKCNMTKTANQVHDLVHAIGAKNSKKHVAACVAAAQVQLHAKKTETGTGVYQKLDRKDVAPCTTDFSKKYKTTVGKEMDPGRADTTQENWALMSDFEKDAKMDEAIKRLI